MGVLEKKETEANEWWGQDDNRDEELGVFLSLSVFPSHSLIVDHSAIQSFLFSALKNSLFLIFLPTNPQMFYLAIQFVHKLSVANCHVCILSLTGTTVHNILFVPLGKRQLEASDTSAQTVHLHILKQNWKYYLNMKCETELNHTL